MKLAKPLLAAMAVPLCSSSSSVAAATDQVLTTTSDSRGLRGARRVHTRNTYVQRNKETGSFDTEPLIDPRQISNEEQHHHYGRVQGKNAKGEIKSITLDLDQLDEKFPHDAEIFIKNNHHFRGEQASKSSTPPRATSTGSQGVHGSQHKGEHHPHHHSHRADSDLSKHSEPIRFEGHDDVERQHEHLYHRHEHSPKNSTTKETKKYYYGTVEEDVYSLPTGTTSHFNATLYFQLHDAPYHVYEAALGVDYQEDDDAFPIFALPHWAKGKKGIFTGFSKSAKPLIFETLRFLLTWNDIVEASSTPIPRKLRKHMEETNFHSNLIIAKSIGDGANVPFIGMVVSYYQNGHGKDVLIPLSHLEDFFDDTSEHHLLSDETKSWEMAAVQELLEEKREGQSHLYHPSLAHTAARKNALESLEVTHFQKLFQLLIRRSYLFSFGYADCLLNQPWGLRQCLDEAYSDVIRLETGTRGALDEQLVTNLAEINETKHISTNEACMEVQGDGSMLYGRHACYNGHGIGSFTRTAITRSVLS